MDQTNGTYESLLYEFTHSIKRFNNALVDRYNLIDLPYSVSGKVFPKIGSVEIDNQAINYRFHGSGCTLWENDKEIYFGVNPASQTPLVITPGALSVYLKNPTNLVDGIIKYLEAKGALIPMPRNRLHYLNEEWYSLYQSKLHKV